MEMPDFREVFRDALASDRSNGAHLNDEPTFAERLQEVQVKVSELTEAFLSMVEARMEAMETEREPVSSRSVRGFDEAVRQVAPLLDPALVEAIVPVARRRMLSAPGTLMTARHR